MNKKALIIGFGSIGRQHYKVLKKLKIFNKIYICSKHYKNVNCFSNINDILKINPDLIIICSETSKHLKQLKFFESNFKNKKIIIEKPIFSKSCLLKIKNNQVFVGYNLRYDPMLQYLKKKIQTQKNIISTNIVCNSYLPSWRAEDYSKTYSANKYRGGGVHLDLSHEVDYANWIFKDLKKINIFSKKISKLKINSNDYLNFLGKSKFSKILTIKLSYFSLKEQRKVEIFSEKNYILVNLLSRTIKMLNFKKNKIIKFKKFNALKRIEMQIKDILSKKPINACTFDESTKILDILGV